MAHSSSFSVSMSQGSDILSSLTDETQDSTEVDEMYCEACHSEGTYRAAMAFCEDCVEYFCSRCLRFHQRFLSNHKHLENEDMPQDVCLEKCVNHTDQLIKFYCDKCDKFACMECKKSDHMNCSTVTHIPELAKGIENGQELKHIEQSLRTLDNKLKDISGNITENTRTNEKNEEDAKFAIENQAKHIVKLIEKNKYKLRAKLEEMKQKNNDKLKSVSVQHSKLKTEVETLTQQIKTQKECIQRCKLFMTLKRAKKNIKDYERKLSEADKENEMQEYKFEAGATLKALAENGNEFGKIVTAESAESAVQDINVKAENENLDNAVFSMCLINEHFLVVCDGRNSSIKVVDLKTNNIKSVLPMTNPICVRSTSHSKLAVACINVCELSFISISMSGILHLLDQKIKLEMPCWDLVSKNDQIIVALFQIKSPSPGKIQILDKNGMVLSSFQTHFMGQDFHISKLALSFDKSSLFMIDLMKDIVIKMSTNGKVEALYEDNNLRQLTGLATSKSGSVYVCDSGSYKIHRLPAECSSSNVILDRSDGIWRPIAVAYSESDEKLYIGQAHQNSIKVYKLEQPGP